MDLRTCVELLEEIVLKDNNNAESIYLLGRCYLIGHHNDEAIKYFKQAADLGNIRAMMELASLYHKGGVSLDKDLDKAVEYSKLAIATLESDTSYLLIPAGNLKFSSREMEDEETSEYFIYQELYPIFEKESNLGNVSATTLLANCYLYGKGIEKPNYPAAVKLFRQAVSKGNTAAMVSLACCYKNGEGVEQDYYKTIELLQQAADLANPDGFYYLGLIHSEGGDNLPKDLNAAFIAFEKAAILSTSQGSPCADSHYQLGLCYYHGHGIDKDLKKAVEYFKKAVEGGHIEANVRLGDCYLNGEGVKCSQSKAISCYLDAANFGSIEGSKLFAIQGVFTLDYDPNNYIEEAEKAVNVGDVEAINWLGEHYFEKIEQTEDDDIDNIKEYTLQAIYYFEKAIERGSLENLKALAECYKLVQQGFTKESDGDEEEDDDEEDDNENTSKNDSEAEGGDDGEDGHQDKRVKLAMEEAGDY